MDKAIVRNFGHGAVMFALFFALVAQSIRAEDALFQEEISILNRSDIERNDGFSKAMSRVLNRLTGRLSEADAVALEPIIDAAPAYVAEYEYRGRDDLKLWVRFDDKAVKRALHSAGVAYGKSARPSVLVWIALEEDGDRMWLEPDYPASAAQAVQAGADRAGIPIVFPLFDLEDFAQVKLPELIEGADAGARASLSRYGAQGVLIGSAIGARGHWRVSWRYYDSVQSATRWTTESSTLASALTDGVGKLGQTLGSQPQPAPDAVPAPAATRNPEPVTAPPRPTPPADPPSDLRVFGTVPVETDMPGGPASSGRSHTPLPGDAAGFPPAPSPRSATAPAPVATGGASAEFGPERGILLVVTGIDSLEDYAKLDHYLRGIALISAQRPRGLGAGKAVFRIETASGSAQELEQQLVQGGELRSVNPWETGVGAPADEENAVYLMLVK